MHAILVNEKKELVWSEVPAPVCKPDEILIEVHAAGVNRADLMQRAGEYPSPPGWPDWPGLEVAGKILEAPAGSGWKKGDAVCALLGGGGYAEKIAVPTGMVLPVPDGLSMTEAAAIPEVFATAYLNFFLETQVKPSDTVLVQAGASGLGIASIQLLKTVGCKIITTVGTAEKAEFVKKLGAAIAVNRETDDLEAVLDRNPVDIALDCVGGPALGRQIGKMNPWGRWILIAALAGAKTEIPLDVIFKKRIRLIGSTLRSRTPEMKAEILSSMRKLLWPEFTSGRIRPVIYRTFPLREAQNALHILEERKNLGKVILTLK